ncbi:MAG: hypothetical protein ACYCSO_02900 [Cuniculiplasma sp.]
MNRNIKAIRIFAAALAILWAGIHMTLASIKVPSAFATEIYDPTFGVFAALSILAAMLFIQGMRSYYPAIAALYTFDLLLLIETRVGPAPFLGVKLPVLPSVILTIVLDIILIPVTLGLFKLEPKYEKS